MRIGFLHPYKMADHYFVEAIEAAAIADLRLDGHDADAVEYVFDAARNEADQLRELRAALDVERFDLLFLQRVWSDDVVEALRGLPLVGWATEDLVERGVLSAAVVEPTREAARAVARAIADGLPLTHVPGVATRIDGVFHHARAPRRLTVLSQLADAEFAYAQRKTLSKSRANEARATVLSNSGCAYRGVPNKTGVFDGVEMPSEVSTAGCTFCDASGYERMSEGDAIALLVRQVRALLEQRPSVREIAIKDDYAVRFIARLGDALRPLDLGDREILLSARADYLLEMRADIEEALAGRFPAKLGFYLIGFENFADAELVRFNKGMSAAQLERSVALMNEWSERFVGRFRVTPSGGFILFTPWTTLEDLRVNADVMRRLGFARFRGKALLSRLRLYPHLPLYWLAKRDGLLLDRFARDDESDASRRGYEADHPWRYLHPKVGEVHRKLLDAAAGSDERALFEVFEHALDEAAGVARGKRGRPQRMAPAPNDVAKKGPSTQQITLNKRCNQTCTFCVHRGDESHGDRARAARAIQAVRAAASEGVRSVVLTGAEPSLEWYLPELIKLAHDLGVGEVVLETNAKDLDVPSLVEAGLDRVRVALNSLNPGISDAITRDPGGHAQTMAGLRALKDAGVGVELAVAMLPDNRGELARIVESGLAKAVVARHVAVGPPGFRALAVADAARELEAAVRAFEKTGTAVSAAVDGELPPCVFENPSAIKGVLRVGRALVERDHGKHRRIAQCEGCAARDVCPGPMASIAAEVAGIARTLHATDSLEGVVQLSRERTRMLQEYRSSFFLESKEGVVERRIVRVNFHCNQACDFCFVSRELPAIEHEIIEREIRDAAASGAELDLSGGEPTLNPRLPEYIRLARELGVRELDLQTNAIKMADRAFAHQLVEAGLNQAFISLHGVTAAVSDRVTAAPGTFVKTIAGVQNLLAEGVAVCLNFVLCGYNVDELALLPDFIDRELGHPGKVVANFSFVAASTDNVPRDTKLIPRFRDVAWALETAYSRATERGLRWTGFDSKCGVPACYLPRALRQEHFAHDLPSEELARAKGFTKSEACGECELDKRCYGIRSTYATMYGVDELRPVRGGEVVAFEPKRAKNPAANAARAAKVTDDAAFARLPVTWADENPGVADRELLQLRAGLRQVIKTERGDVESAEQAAKRARENGLFARVFADPRSSRAIAFIGLEQAPVDEAMEIEPRLVTSFRERLPLVLRMGELLGYPSCCVERFAESAEQTDGALVSRLADEQLGALPPELNWAAADLRLFSQFPCTPTCARTAELARRTLEVITRDRPTFAKALVNALRSVAVLAPDGQYALLENARPASSNAAAGGNAAWHYDRVLSHRNLGVNDRMLGRASFRTFYVETISQLEKGNRLTRIGRSFRIDRDEQLVAELRFSEEPPWLLDFTGDRLVRRLPMLAELPEERRE